MPGVVGSVDGTHVRITRLFDHKKAYVNRKNYHSINVPVMVFFLFSFYSTVVILFLKGICDAHCRFLSVNATKLGSCHDSTVFKGSLIGRKFINGVFGNGFLLGDSGYACATYLLTPYENPSTPKEVVIKAGSNCSWC